MGGKGVTFAAITDGLADTILVGEKHVPFGNFGVGWWDCSLYNGDYWTCSGRPAGPDYPLAKNVNELGMVFGSYHPGVCQFGFADGHVRPLAVTIDPNILGLLANYQDGKVVPDY